MSLLLAKESITGMINIDLIAFNLESITNLPTEQVANISIASLWVRKAKGDETRKFSIG